MPRTVLIHETFNPGAVNRVSVFKLDGSEFEAWKGKDPTPVGSGMGISEIPIKVDFKTNRVKIYLKSKEVPGWNEIDAVGLRDKAGKAQWATAAEASSTYAQGPYRAISVDYVERLEQKVDRLEALVLKLRKANKELTDRLNKKK